MSEDLVKRTLIKHVLNSNAFGEPIKVAGWVRTRRDSKGGFSFVELNDGSSFSGVQVIVPGELENYESEVLLASIGSAIAVEGELVESPGKGQRVEVHATKVTVYGLADPDEYPLQKKRISFEKLRDIAHLRPRTNTFGAVARVRNSLAYATH